MKDVRYKRLNFRKYVNDNLRDVYKNFDQNTEEAH